VTLSVTDTPLQLSPQLKPPRST